VLDPALIRTQTPYVHELWPRAASTPTSRPTSPTTPRCARRAPKPRSCADRKTIARAVADLGPDDPAAEKLRTDGTASAERLTELTARQTGLENACREFLDPLPNLFPVKFCVLRFTRLTTCRVSSVQAAAEARPPADPAGGINIV
jgi:hypothetical protein